MNLSRTERAGQRRKGGVNYCTNKRSHAYWFPVQTVPDTLIWTVVYMYDASVYR